MLRRVLLRSGLLGVTLLGLSGCFTTTADYRAEAETFIVEEVDLPNEPDVSFPTATCEEPADQESGTTFGCRATDNDGATWTFEVTIEDDNRFVVAIVDRP